MPRRLRRFTVLDEIICMLCSIKNYLTIRLTRLEIGAVVLFFLLGTLVGGLVTAHWLSDGNRQPEFARQKAKPNAWPPDEFHTVSGWHFLKVDQDGWSTGAAGSFQELNNRLAEPIASNHEIIIPIFPTVYAPKIEDKIYHDAILASDIKAGDKVLVIGTGSGADAWLASLKSKAPIYIVEINPVAIANARVTARLGQFQIKAVEGDVTRIQLPDDFRDFDFVLWNMPFVWKQQTIAANKLGIEGNRFHDGDDGTLLKRFLVMLPALLKDGGEAMVLNSHPATNIITAPDAVIKANEACVLFVIPNPAMAFR
jgi:tRNA1(Val) A37 N6-methylase TrmN6